MILTIVLYKINKSSDMCLSCHSCPNENCEKKSLPPVKNDDLPTDPLKDERYLKIKAHLDK
jgi:nitrate reductase cytochrome c-type subunit